MAQEASENLRLKRDNLITICKETRHIALPGETTGEQTPRDGSIPEPFQYIPSQLSTEIYGDDLVPEVCDFSTPYIHTETDVVDATIEEPDDYDIEVAKAMEAMLSREQSQEHTEPVFQIPGLICFNPVSEEKLLQQAKRKRESVLSPQEPSVDESDTVQPSEKRRKVEVSPPEGSKKGRKDRRGKVGPSRLFRESGSLALVFQATFGVGSTQTLEEGSCDAPELTGLDYELLGGDSSDSIQAQSSVTQDLEEITTEEEPSPVVTTPRAGRSKDRLRRVVERTLKRYDKSTWPSEKVSRREERMLAQMEQSALVTNEEEPKAEKKSSEARAKEELSVSRSNREVSSSKALPRMPDVQWSTTGSEAEAEMAEWEKEKQKHRQSALLLFLKPSVTSARAVRPSGAWSGME